MTSERRSIGNVQTINQHDEEKR